MRFIADMREGDSVGDIYLVKQKRSLTTKNGKAYESLVLQDRTGTIDAKIWDPGSPGIGEFDALDYVDIVGDVTSFQGNRQLNVKRARHCRDGEYDPANYVPTTEKDSKELYAQLIRYVNDVVQEPHLKRLLQMFFVEDQDFIRAFRISSAAKAIHHGFVGGLLEHTVSVTNLCYYYCKAYPLLNRDLLITAALLHDIGKVRELSAFPANDYTEEGQFIGHIIIGVEMIDGKMREIPDFPSLLAMELRHCILAHHGELEYGSPKKPAIMEAAALHYADNTDAHLETFKELLTNGQSTGWIGYQNTLGSNIRKTE